MARQPTKPTNRDRQRIRHHELIRACIGNEVGEITYEHVGEFYKDWAASHWKTPQDSSALRAHFKKDCNTLVDHFAEFAGSYLAPFFLPAPVLKFDRSREVLSIVSGLRPIAKDKNALRDLIPNRRMLSKFIANASDGAGQLIPRNGRIFAGH